MTNTDTIQEREARHSVFFEPSRGEEEAARAATRCMKSEKGVVLVVVLVISAVVLVVMTTLIYMITSGTQISGLQKRYKTALEAAKGGSDIVYQLIGSRGDTSIFTGVVSTTSINNPSTCTGKDINTGMIYTGFQAKLRTFSSTWSASCNSSLTIDPTDPNSYDIKLVIGSSPKYNFYAKIIGTQEGNSGSSVAGGLYTGSVITASGGIGAIPVVSQPYLYALEVDTENASNPAERAKLSILYQY